MMLQRHGRWCSNLERADAHFTTKITQHSNFKTHKAEEILEGERAFPWVSRVLVDAMVMTENAPQCCAESNILV